MKNEDLSVIASEVAEKLFQTLYKGKDMDIVEVEYNHYEVVLSDQVIKIIQERLPK